MSTVGHLISFAVGYKDATRIAHDLVMPTLDGFIKDAPTDLYGTYGKASYWGVGDQVNHITGELMRQGQRQCLWRVRKANDIAIYFATAAHVETLVVSPEQEAAYRQASAQHHAKTDATAPTPKPEAQPIASPPTPSVFDAAPVAIGTAPLQAETVPPSKGLSLDEQGFLKFVGMLDALLPVREIYKRLKMSADKGTRLKAQLIEAGLMIEVEVPLHAKGRNSKLLVLTSKGLDAVHLPIRAGKGGALHQHLQRVIATQAEQQRFTATVEAVGKNGKAVDIGLEKAGQRIAVELCITTRAQHELQNILEDLQGGYERVITLCVAPAVVDTLQRLVGEQDAAVAARVHCGLIKDYVSLLREITEQCTGEPGD